MKVAIPLGVGGGGKGDVMQRKLKPRGKLHLL